MEPKLKWPLSLVFLVALAGSALGGTDTLFERQGNDGSVELTNIPEDGGNYRTVASPPAPAAAKQPAGTASAASAAQGSTGPGAQPSYSGTEPVADSSPRESGPVPMRERLRSLYDAARAARAAAASHQ